MSTYFPLVSIVLPVYNRPHVINTINSIINQTYKNLEILIIDNASTDNTVQAIRSISDNRIRLLINEENRGQTYSLNRGLKEATGKYIVRIDSDDLAFPKRIEKQVNFLENHTDFVLVGSWVQFISDDDKIGMVVKMPTTSEGMEIMHTVSCGMYHASAMYRRETIIENNLSYDPNIHMAEDYDLWVKLMKFGKACNLPEPLIYYRRGNDNDSRRYRDVMGKESTEIRRRVCAESQISDKEKEYLNDEINLETIENKNVFQIIKICRFYHKYLNEKVPKNSPDYAILKRSFIMRIYGSCFASSEAWYAPAVRWLYNNLKRIKNRQRGKLS